MNGQKDGPPGTPKPDNDWLRRLLETKLGGFRNARWQRCRTCNEIVLQGLDADLCAGEVTVDVAPLTERQEYWCAIQGRRTYSLEIDPDRKIKINDRIRWALATPHPRGNPIVAEHICGQGYSGFVEALRKPPTATATAKPPF